MSGNLEPRSIVYKTVGELEISLDIYLPPSAQSVPVLLWFHGGGLLQGHRSGVAPHLKRSVEKYKHAVISADYRLAPQATIDQIFEDVRDCVQFIQSTDGLSKHVGEEVLDTRKLAVSGSSAGGYLAFLAGLYCEPKPSVILPIYPITDPLGYFFTNSQPMPLFKPPGKVDTSKKVTKEELGPYLVKNAEAIANSAQKSSRSNFYYYMLDQANLAELLGFRTGKSAYSEPKNDRWRIAKSIQSHGLPPTYVVHGDVDRAVGIEQADEVVGVMVGLGLTVQYDRLQGADHLFDLDSGVGLDQMYKFMHKHIAGSKL
ncbi:hypothetical protein AMS68_005015 [Peltaster fructicola]|uniref:BD-FAE-like domain-containing protein n=1 Tax=Peltaster fructicola TaxID=286661 RepID=A0A6H0XY29_9PEZI|nr:hypothetical protein AMS68_005015 [Peltaster fructicola]